MIAIDRTLAPTFHGGGKAKKRRSLRTAYRDAAWQAWRATYPCECDHEVGFTCGEHKGEGHATSESHEWTNPRAEYRRKVIDRLARWLRWRDRVAPVVARPIGVGDAVAFKHGTEMKVGTVARVSHVATAGNRVLSIVTAAPGVDPFDHRQDVASRWAVPEPWCVLIDFGTRKPAPSSEGAR